MARYRDAKCKLCRRAGEKLFLKGDRCITPKCAMVRKAYAPGMHGKTMSRGASEFGKQLAMKQKIKRIYGVLERQFRKHYEEVLHKPGVTGDLLMQRLEMRLDTVVFRLGFAASRTQARQLVTHGLFLVNGKKMTIPSAQMSVGDVISVSKNKSEKNYFQNVIPILKGRTDFPSWFSFDSENFSGTITAEPKIDELGVTVDPQLVVVYYSK